ncbi:MAG: type II toxin-antitoxin system VapB family antitoxin [Clostridia bacterium]|nr:type II toxin-antitoxin system VapB family antitoxin [Clostridia bacterium]
MDAVKVHTTKPFMSGRSQAVRIPKAFQLDDTEVVVNRVGDSIVITPRASLQKMFFEGISKLSDDFLADGRPEEVPNDRVEF